MNLVNRTLSLALVAIALIGCGGGQDAEDQAASTPIDTQSTESDSIERYLPDTLHQMTLLDTLRGANGAAWMLVSGVECSDCDAPETIWLTRDTASGPEQGPYDYPGEDFEMGVEGGEPHGRSRMFVGDCLAEPGDEIVTHVSEREPSGTWRSWAHVVRLGPTIAEDMLPDDPALVERLAAREGCREVAGRTQYTAPS